MENVTFLFLSILFTDMYILKSITVWIDTGVYLRLQTKIIQSHRILIDYRRQSNIDQQKAKSVNSVSAKSMGHLLH